MAWSHPCWHGPFFCCEGWATYMTFMCWEGLMTPRNAIRAKFHLCLQWIANFNPLLNFQNKRNNFDHSYLHGPWDDTVKVIVSFEFCCIKLSAILFYCYVLLWVYSLITLMGLPSPTVCRLPGFEWSYAKIPVGKNIDSNWMLHEPGVSWHHCMQNVLLLSNTVLLLLPVSQKKQQKNDQRTNRSYGWKTA